MDRRNKDIRITVKDLPWTRFQERKNCRSSRKYTRRLEENRQRSERSISSGQQKSKNGLKVNTDRE